jgi:hypothetical protein
MHRIVVNVQTGEVTQVELTAEEIAQAEAQYAAWLAEQPPEPDTPADEENQIV